MISAGLFRIIILTWCNSSTDSTTEPSGTYTLRAIISEVKQDNETVGGYQPSLLPIWIPLSSCAVVVATAFIFIKCRSERRKKSRRKRRGCEAVESDDDDMTMLETTRLLLPPGIIDDVVYFIFLTYAPTPITSRKILICNSSKYWVLASLHPRSKQ